jgi:anti-sigma factor RsiW
VKPWFAGRLDFAPILAFGGDDDFPLVGGAVGWFVDRKAATFVFKRRLHVITLQVFRAEGLSFATSGLRHVGRIDLHSTTTRGYHVSIWRDGDLGYALVSDVDERELDVLAQKISGG